MPLEEIALFTAPLVVGAIALALVRWARRREAELLKREPNATSSGYALALSQRRFRKSGELCFFGPLPQGYERLGKLLALCVCIALGGGLLFLAVMLAAKCASSTG